MYIQKNSEKLICFSEFFLSDLSSCIISYFDKNPFHIIKFLAIICCFGIFFEFCLNLMNIWLQSLSYKWEIYYDCERPSNETNYYRSSDKCPKSSCYSSDEIGPKHLPWRSNIFNEFLKSNSSDGIY